MMKISLLLLVVKKIIGKKCVKLLGIKIDNNLDINDHLSTIYEKSKS